MGGWKCTTVGNWGVESKVREKGTKIRKLQKLGNRKAADEKPQNNNCGGERIRGGLMAVG